MTAHLDRAHARRSAQRWAQVELDNCRLEEFEPTVEYRLAVRTITDWESVP